MITIVAGPGRCMTSLVMQMLFRGGMQVSGRWSYFEDTRATRLTPWDWSWIEEYHGKAIKILDPAHYQLSKGLEARTIWLTRDIDQMVKSWRKFHVARAKELGLARPAPLPPKRVTKDRLLKACKDGIKVLETASDEKGPLVLKAENVIAFPPETAEAIVKHLDIEMDPVEMAKASIKRGSDCLPDMLEEHLDKLGPDLGQSKRTSR
jgi:hypothetical protein